MLIALYNVIIQALGKLCDLLNTGQKLPPEIASKRKVLEKMCIKLKSSDSYSNTDITNIFTKSPYNEFIIGLSVIGGSYYIWNNRREVFRILRRQFIRLKKWGGGGHNSDRKASTDNREKMRKARLKQYAAAATKNDDQYLYT